MGQKVNPISLRLGINKTWDSKWFVGGKKYADYLHIDLKMRAYLLKELKNAEVSKVEIVRYPEKITLNIYTARPGIVIGSKGQKIDDLSKNLKKFTDKSIHVNIKEVKYPDLDAMLVAKGVARQLESRRSYRRAMKIAIQKAVDAGIKGIKISVSGRLGGAEMKRRETYKEGRIPLHTLRADIDFAKYTALTTYGIIGIKVWLFKGEIFGQDTKTDAGATLLKKKTKE